MGKRDSHRRQAFGGRVDQDHGVSFPRLAGRLVSHTAPEVDHFLATVIHAAGAAEFVAAREIFGECMAHGLETRTDMALDADSAAIIHRATPSRPAKRSKQSNAEQRLHSLWTGARTSLICVNAPIPGEST